MVEKRLAGALMMKKTLLISSLIIIAVLGAEAYRENLDMQWQKYQKEYKNELTRLAETEQEKITADNYKIQMRQIVMPEFNNRADRCVTCHVAMEDSRMENMPQPLKSHPGDYLNEHDINKVGCTFCHDGQGRAITADDAHAQSDHKYWEKPILQEPFIQANCSRCHMNVLSEGKEYNHGKKLFETMGCIGCHKLRGEGGTTGPELTDIGNASFHMKAPIESSRDELLEKYHHNVNLAYLYESVIAPAAQPSETLMPDYGLSEEDATALVIYLKSLTKKRRVMDVGQYEVVQVAASSAASTTAVEGNQGAIQKMTEETFSAGYTIFSTQCVACHTIGEGDRIGPDLKGVVSRRDRTWLKEFIQTPSVMLNGSDPIATKLLEQYKVPMIDLGLTDVQVEDVIEYLENPVVSQ